jgi:hypothetical protein
MSLVRRDAALSFNTVFSGRTRENEFNRKPTAEHERWHRVLITLPLESNGWKEVDLLFRPRAPPLATGLTMQ